MLYTLPGRGMNLMETELPPPGRYLDQSLKLTEFKPVSENKLIGNTILI